MKPSLRLRFGLWLAQFPVLDPFIGVYSHTYGDERLYVNRVSGTFLPRRNSSTERES